MAFSWRRCSLSSVLEEMWLSSLVDDGLTSIISKRRWRFKLPLLSLEGFFLVTNEQSLIEGCYTVKRRTSCYIRNKLWKEEE